MTIRDWARGLREGKWEMRLALVVTLAVGILLGTLISKGVRAGRDNPAPGATPLTVPSAVELSSAFSQVAKAVEPAVVNINTESVVTTERRRPSFKDFLDPFDNPDAPGRFREESLGSGMIVDPDGYILTNYHVIQGADKILVRLAGDNKNYRARVVGYDQETDLAVIKIDADRKLPVVKMGNSDAAQVGDWVLAIGSPFGLEATVTAGIVSYKGRPAFSARQQFQRFIQTDAAINRGNSGGPLVSLAGEVIGVNTAIFTESPAGGNAGVGFALASNIAVEVYNQIIKSGHVVRGSIGITFQGAASENEAILRSFGADHGVIIGEVVPGGPADKASLRRGDVITEVDGTPVRSGDDLVNKVAATPVGQRVKIRYIRDKKPSEVSVVIEERAKVFADTLGEEPKPEAGEEANGQLGLSLEELTPAVAQRFGLGEDDVGLLVRDVEPGSFADEIRLQRGDVILEVNQRRVRSRAEFSAIQRQLRPGSDVVFWLKRRTPGGWTPLYLGGTLPE